MAIVIFGGVAGLVLFGIVLGARRYRATKELAAHLGLEYALQDASLAENLQNALPVFSDGAVLCSHVMAGRVDDADYWLFDYAFMTKQYGRANRQTVGLVVCFRRRGTQFPDIDEVQDGWRVQSKNSWLAYVAGKGKEGLAPSRLRAVHDEAVRRYRRRSA